MSLFVRQINHFKDEERRKMTFPQTAVTKAIAGFQEKYQAFLLYCTKAWKCSEILKLQLKL